MKKSLIAGLSISISILLLNSCSKSNDTPAAVAPACTLSVSFNANIKRILDANCNACHAPGSGNVSALAKWTYDGLYASAFANKTNINTQVAAGFMPQTAPLPQIVRDSISCWVNKGAPN